MTVTKAISIRRHSGAASSRLIQTFLREGMSLYHTQKILVLNS